jgi:hypothetical protein
VHAPLVDAQDELGGQQSDGVLNALHREEYRVACGRARTCVRAVYVCVCVCVSASEGLHHTLGWASAVLSAQQTKHAGI